MSQHHIEVRVCAETFAQNIRYLRDRIFPAQLCVVMKANAYGHGLAALAPIAVAAGADYIGICTNAEAAIIRNLGLNIKVLRLRMGFPEEFEEAIAQLNIEEQVGTMEVATYLSNAGVQRNRTLRVHLNIDTGMGRSGFFNHQIEELKKVCHLPGLKIVGIMTHFASADGTDLTFTQKQIEDFHNIRQALNNYLPETVLTHAHNSAATLRLNPKDNGLARIGAACYGVRTSQNFNNPSQLKPVMSVRTKVAQIRKIPAGRTIGYGSLYTTKRDSIIASLPVGFGEGYPRSLFNKGMVLIKGHRCPVVGRISLNITTVDITDIPETVQWGDEAVLIGQQGHQEITFEELADRFNSVHTEINLMVGFLNQISYTGLKNIG
jgi:alanine racemase